MGRKTRRITHYFFISPADKRKTGKVAYGITLIEVIVAIALSAMLATTLLLSFNQLIRFSGRAEEIIDTDERFVLLFNQLEKDIKGIFVPTQAQETTKEEPPKKDAEKQPDTQANQEKTAKQQPETIEKKILKNIFFCKNKEKMFQEFSFITNNPAQAYLQAPNTKAHPRTTRVFYRLEKDEDDPSLFSITRQQGQVLEVDAYKGAQKGVNSYVLLTGIKECSFEFVYPKPESKKNVPVKQPEKEPEKNEKKVSKKDESQKKQEYITVREWSAQEKERPQIAQFVKITVTLEGEPVSTMSMIYEISAFRLLEDKKIS